MPRWPKGHKKRTDRNYPAETQYENLPEQVSRRVERNKDNRAAKRKGLIHKGDGKEVDHLGSDRTGTLAGRRTRVVSRSVNRRRQPKRS